MNLLSLIIIFLAVVICGAVAFIAWELTSEAGPGGTSPTDEERPQVPAEASGADSGSRDAADDVPAGNRR